MSEKKTSARGRKRTQTDSTRKRNRNAFCSKWTRICIGDQLDRRNELKDVLHVQTHAEVAKILLDSVVLQFSKSKMDPKISSKCRKLLVAAIDFGTTYSGYAFSSTHAWDKVMISCWQGGSLLSLKAPTCLLLKKDFSLSSFGYDAEEKYSDLTWENKHQDYYFFQRFQMILFGDDIRGETIEAGIVFMHCIKYLKNHLYQETKKGFPHMKDDDIQYVLTVPAIGGDNAKEFMGKAAIEIYLNCESDAIVVMGDLNSRIGNLNDILQGIDHIPKRNSIDSTVNQHGHELIDFLNEASFCVLNGRFPEDKFTCISRKGIKNEHLIIALESEAASIYCQYLHIAKEDTSPSVWDLGVVKPGTKYMMVDLGGVTADIMVHQKSVDSNLEKIIPASGGPWGGKSVDDVFMKFMTELMGEKVMEDFKKESMEDYLEIMRTFETKKRTIKPDKDGKTNVTIPQALLKLCAKSNGVKDFKDVIDKHEKHRNDVKYAAGKLKWENEYFRGFFKKTIDSIVKHIDEVFEEDVGRDVDTIVMVGGFSECLLVQDAIKKNFKQKTVLVPEDAGLAILKGAVYIGHLSNDIPRTTLQS